MRFLISVVVFSLTCSQAAAQQLSTERKSLPALNSYLSDLLKEKRLVQQQSQQQPRAGALTTKSLTLSEAVDLFLQQNLAIVAARYDIETADAEKLTARVRPNPEFAAAFDDLPLDFSGPFFSEQEIA